MPFGEVARPEGWAPGARLVVSVVRGLLAPFRGALFVARHRLWGYVMLPVVLNVCLAAGAIALAVPTVRANLGPSFSAGHPTLTTVVLALASVLLAVGLLIVAQPIVSAPFVDLLSERAEAIVRGGPAASVGMVRSALVGLWHGALKAALYAFAFAVTFVLGAATGIGGALGVGLTAIFLAYDAFDYPLARRNASFGGKWRYLLLHPGQTVGYCVGASLLYLVPFAALVAPAFAAVGATLVFLERDRSAVASSAAAVTGDSGQEEGQR